MATYRQVYMIMRARDDASRVMRGMGRTMGYLNRQQEQLANASVAANAKTKQAIQQVTQAQTQQLAQIKAQTGDHVRHIQRQEQAQLRAVRSTRNANIEAHRALMRPRETTISQLTEENALTRKLLETGEIKGRQARKAARIQIAENNHLIAQEKTQLTGKKQLIEAERTQANQRIADVQRTHKTAVAAVQDRERAEAGAIKRTNEGRKNAIKLDNEETQNNIKNSRNKVTNIQRVQGQIMGASQAGLIMGGVLGAAGVRGTRAFMNMADASAEFSNRNRVAISVAKDFTRSVEDLGAAVLDVAREVPVPIEDLQETFYYTFSALDVGFRQAKDLVRGFANEAVVGNAEIADAARSSIALINAYEMDVKTAKGTTETLTRIQNMQFNTVKWGALQYDDLSTNIGKVIPAAVRAGQDIEQIGGVLAFLTRQGLSAEMAATSAARAMELIVEPRVISRLERMGVRIRDNMTGEMLQLNDIVVNLGRHLKGLDPAGVENVVNALAPLDADESQKYINLLRETDRVTRALSGPERAQALQNIFKGAGNRIQARRFWDLALKNYQELDRLTKNIITDTDAFRVASEMAFKEPAVAIKIYENQLEALKTTIGMELIPVKMMLMETVLKLVDSWNSLDENVRRSIVRFLGFAAPLAAVTGGFIFLVSILGLVTTSLIPLAAALLGTASGVKVVMLALAMGTVIPAVLGAITGGLILLIANWDAVVDAMRAFFTWGGRLDEPIEAIAFAVVLLTGTIVGMAAAWGTVGPAAATAIATIKGALAAMGKFALMHPVLLALAATVGAVTYAVYKLSEGSRRAAAATRDYSENLYANREALQANADAVDILNRKQLVDRMQKEGLIEDAKRLGLSSKTLADAIMGEESALAKVNEAIEENRGWYLLSGPEKAKNITASRNLASALDRESSAMEAGIQAYYERAHAVGGVESAVASLIQTQREGGPQDSAERAAIARLQELIANSGNAESALAGLSPEMRQMAADAGLMAEEVGGVGEAVFELSDSAKLMQDVLKEINNVETAFGMAKEGIVASLREVHAQALESGDMTDAAFQKITESAVKNSTATAQAWITQLEEQERIHNEFVNNMQTVMDRGGAGVIDTIMDMGEESVSAMATMANSGDAEFDRLNELLTGSAKRTSDETILQMEALKEGMTRAIADGISQSLFDFNQGMKLMEANAAAGGRGTRAGLAKQLGMSVRDVMRLSRQYGIDLADNINPILTGLGKEQISLHNARTRRAERDYIAGQPIRGGLNTGGRVPGSGPDRDSVLIHATPDEYVTRRKIVREQGIRAFEMLNSGKADIVPRGYQRGGRVTGDIHGLNPELFKRLSAFSAMVGQTYNVTSGLRTVQEQQVLYNRYLRGQGAPAARPGRSMHNKGLASDGPRWFNRNPGRAGLVYPMSYEPWHVEPIGGRQMRGSAMMWQEMPKVPSMPHNGIFQSAPRALNAVRDRAQAFMDANAFRPVSVPGGVGDTPAPGSLKAMARDMLSVRGWGQYWPQFDELVRRESSWRPTAQNPTSTAYGLGQFLNSTWGTVGGRKTSDPRLQLQYMMAYISQRYGNPAAALGFHNRNNWYNQGGLIPLQTGGIVTQPTPALIGEGGPEVVLPLDRIIDIFPFREINAMIRQSVREVGGKDLMAQYRLIVDAAGATQAMKDATQALHDARSAVVSTRADLVQLEQSYAEAVATFTEAQAAGKSMSLESERTWLQAEVRVKNLRQELEAMKGGGDEALVAEAKVNQARAELARVEQILPTMDNEVQRMLVQFKAEAELADAVAARNKVTLTSSEELRIKEIELALAEQELNKAFESRLDYNAQYYESQKMMGQIQEEYSNKQKALKDAVDAVTQAELASMNATIGVVEATKALEGVSPLAERFFRNVAQNAGVSASSIFEMVRSMHDLNRVNLDLSRSSRVNVSDRAKRVMAGGFQSVADYVEAYFGQHGVKITAEIQRVINGLSASILAGRRTFGSAKEYVARYVAEMAEGGVVRSRRGGTLALIGEAGRDEAVIPLPHAWQAGSSTNSTREVNINLPEGMVQITIQGDVTEESLPKVKTMIDDAVEEFKLDLYQTMSSYGY